MKSNQNTNKPLSPKHTALWLIEHTSLTFRQIADFCQLHLAEVENLADEESKASITELSPIAAGETTLEAIKIAENDPLSPLQFFENEPYDSYVSNVVNKKKSKSTKGHEKHDAILWTLRHHPEISEQDLSKLFKTTKNLIRAIKSGSHPKSHVLTPKNPVTLGLCKEEDFMAIVNSSN